VRKNKAVEKAVNVGGYGYTVQKMCVERWEIREGRRRVFVLGEGEAALFRPCVAEFRGCLKNKRWPSTC
jgi:hypothetical protein